MLEGHAVAQRLARFKTEQELGRHAGCLRVPAARRKTFRLRVAGMRTDLGVGAPADAQIQPQGAAKRGSNRCPKPCNGLKTHREFRSSEAPLLLWDATRS